MNYIKYLLILTSLAISFPSKSQLSIEKIMKGEDFTGYWPENVSWSEDGRNIYFDWNPEMNAQASLYKISLDNLVPQKVDVQEERSLDPGNGKYNNDYTKKVFSRDGDIFLLDIKSQQTSRVTNTVLSEKNPSFSNRGKSIVYQYGYNLFSWSIKDGTLEQLTDFEPGEKSKKEEESPQQDWLKEEESSLILVLRKRQAAREIIKAHDDSLKFKRPKAFYLKGRELRDLAVSPDERFVTFNLLKPPANEKVTHVPDYVTESAYTEMKSSRPNVGRPETTAEFGIYDRSRDSVYFLDTKQVPGIYDKPDFLRDYVSPDSTFNPEYKNPKEVNVLGPVYNSTGTEAVVVILSLDNKDRWIMKIDLVNARLKLLDHQRDEAWIGGPGIVGWDASLGNIGWLKDDRTLWYQSEVTGFSQLYTINTETGNKKAITTGNYEIYKVKLSRSGKYFYLQADKESPFDYQFYRVPVTGGDMVKITTMTGRNEVSMSPDESQLAVIYSYSNKPPELYLMPNKPGAAMQKITSSTTQEFQSYLWRDPEIISFKARDSATVYARLYKPVAHTGRGPGVIFVHGAGYLHNVHKWWSEYFREYMFNNFLCDHGYTVLDIDYRGSAGYGRDWRTAIYRHMGGKDLTDQVDGACYLIGKQNVDSSRVGIYGGSYGGFITLMAMFRYPDVFKCGAALRSVTDWAHYNHGYTSNILNTPVEDSLAYIRSSPIYYADGLKGELLMLHGVVDTNVHFQDIVRLTQRLIELGKTNWHLAVFPMESHGFVETSSWVDEYKRIFDLFERNLK